MPRPGSASTADRESTYDLLIDEMHAHRSGDADLRSGLDIVPATVDLSGAEIELVEVEERTHRLTGRSARPRAAGTCASSIARRRSDC